MIITPLLDLVRNSIIMLAALAIIYYCLKGIHIGIFVAITIVATTVIVLFDIFFNIATASCARGKMKPLADRDPQLQEQINLEWDLLTNGGKPLQCFVMDGESGHSNCYVNSS